MLALDGRVTVRRGARGGIRIRAQDVSKRELVRLAAETDRAIEDVYEFREVVERAAARLAAEHAKPKQIRKLRYFARKLTNALMVHFEHPLASQVVEFLALDSQFHAEIAKLSGKCFICEAVERALAARYARLGAVFRALSAHANDGHEALVGAIAPGQGARAERIMSAHVHCARSKLVSGLSALMRRNTAR